MAFVRIEWTQKYVGAYIVIIIDNPDYAPSPYLALYLTDFKKEIERIDSIVFSQPNHSRGLIRILEAMPEGALRLPRIKEVVASFVSTTPSVPMPTPKVLALKKNAEGYLIWGKDVEDVVSAMFRSGQADVALRAFWFRAAIALVRRRVLFRRQDWFPSVTLRTCENIRRHAELFGVTVFAEISSIPGKLHESGLSTSVEIDVRLTQLLVDAVLANDGDEARALRFLTEN